MNETTCECVPVSKFKHYSLLYGPSFLFFLGSIYIIFKTGALTTRGIFTYTIIINLIVLSFIFIVDTLLI